MAVGEELPTDWVSGNECNEAKELNQWQSARNDAQNMIGGSSKGQRLARLLRAAFVVVCHRRILLISALSKQELSVGVV